MQYIKRKLITFLAKNLLPVVDDKDIISFSKGREGKPSVIIKGTIISDEELANLKLEADYFMQTRLYQLIHNYYAELTRKKMFLEGTDITDLVFGKTVLYTLSVQDTICNNIINAKSEEKKV